MVALHQHKLELTASLTNTLTVPGFRRAKPGLLSMSEQELQATSSSRSCPKS